MSVPGRRQSAALLAAIPLRGTLAFTQAGLTFVPDDDLPACRIDLPLRAIASARARAIDDTVAVVAAAGQAYWFAVSGAETWARIIAAGVLAGGAQSRRCAACDSTMLATASECPACGHLGCVYASVDRPFAS